MKRWHISISGQGRFHCTLPGEQPDDLIDVGPDDSHSFELAAGSILWSGLLILRLKRFDDDNMINLVVLSDAVSEDEFRRLSVACRWINSHARPKKT